MTATLKYLGYILLLLAVLALTSCRPEPFVQTIVLPDTMHTSMGPIPVTVVDSIHAPEITGVVIGRYTFWERRIYLHGQIKAPLSALKVLRHEQCHAMLIESGLQRYLPDDLTEALCDMYARELVAEAVRGRP